MSEDTGFLDEAPRVRSMTRLVILLMAIAEVVLVLALAVYLLAAKRLTGAPPDPTVITAVGVPVGALAAGIWSALRERAGETLSTTGGSHAGD